MDCVFYIFWLWSMKVLICSCSKNKNYKLALTTPAVFGRRFVDYCILYFFWYTTRNWDTPHAIFHLYFWDLNCRFSLKVLLGLDLYRAVDGFFIMVIFCFYWKCLFHRTFGKPFQGTTLWSTLRILCVQSEGWLFWRI